MARVLNFEKIALDLPCALPFPVGRTNLRLMLWAGDGEHGGVSDVKRLPNYDIYVCLAYSEKNIADLVDGQYICLMNFYDNAQMAEFHRMFDGAFAVIDSDYCGNTPTLPLEEYQRLLSAAPAKPVGALSSPAELGFNAPGGVAHNTVGINSIVMPVEDKLNRLELLAPVLTFEQSYARRWSHHVLDLAKRDEIPPSVVWQSPDLKHPYYCYVYEGQEDFERWQKKRNPQWPAHAITLEEHWDQLSLRTLCVSLDDVRMPDDTSATLLEPHLEAFVAYLSKRIVLLKSPRMILEEGDYMAYMALASNRQAGIRILQNILKDMSTELPEGLTGIVGFHRDERRPDAKVFGLSLRRV